ncbi:MAG TPA: cytochrome C oxidase Cbb3 [Gammaproteobacteria bacterium]|nr:cytochrome C oxidase Cbb3 [Gammaproteobacteria bacterium]|tara:strand:- start:455 stop:2311 length:1857 start_codon:yes stop_codon:yes gene_type:complete
MKSIVLRYGPIAMLCFSGQIFADDRDGMTVYKTECASCHDSNTPRTPPFSMLRELKTNRIVSALETGTMRIIGTFNLTGPERVAVSEFITGKPYDLKWDDSGTNFCESAPWPKSDPFAAPHWNGWGNGLANTRFQSAAHANLTVTEVPKLKLKWAFAFPGETFVESQPTVVGGRLFIGSPNGTVYALDAKTGCTHWRFKAEAPVKAPVSVGYLKNGKYALFFGDQSGRVYSLDAANGTLRWMDIGDDHPSARVTGGVQLYNGKLYVPMASWEEVLAMAEDYTCCVFRGSVIAYDSDSGKRLWKQFTIEQTPGPIGEDTNGKVMHGPSGAGVWSAVTIDPKRKLIYIGTGDNYSNPTSDTSDSIMALDLDSGEITWVYQGLTGDAWNVGCMLKEQVNCPKNAGPDEDMGASPILATLPDGSNVLIGAQKSGFAHALDPDAKGAPKWKKKLAKGGVQGGLQWGQATDGKVLYASRSDVRWLSEDGALADDIALDPNAGGGLLAVDLTSGEILWEAPPVSCKDRTRCSPAQGAAVTAMPSVVFSGSQSGEMRAFDALTGKEIWRVDTVRDFDTVNGAKGRGGSIDQAGAVVVDGMVYFNSGYSKFGANPGNVLLSFGLPSP